MSTYQPQQVVGPGRPPCARCGAAYRLHHADVNDTGEQYVLRCPVAYRPATLREAQDTLAQAEASGDPARIFVARGEVQRLEPPCPCECSRGEFCGGCGHRGCGMRRGVVLAESELRGQWGDR